MQKSDVLYVDERGILIYVERNHYNWNDYKVYTVLGFNNLGWFLLSNKH